MQSDNARGIAPRAFLFLLHVAEGTERRLLLFVEIGLTIRRVGRGRSPAIEDDAELIALCLCCDDATIENAKNITSAAATQTAAFIAGESMPPAARASAHIATNETAIAPPRLILRAANPASSAIGKRTMNVATAAEAKSNATSPMERRLHSHAPRGRGREQVPVELVRHTPR
jgi:hypothetical protein